MGCDINMFIYLVLY